MKKKIIKLIEHLNHGLVDREAPIKLVLLTVLAGENIVLVGPPGTAKSLIARRMAQVLGNTQNGGYFEYLLTKFSTPDEIFGPLSISELKADRFRRNTTGYLPCVELAFLDEVFKASSSILNALLTILNERIYHNGAEAQNVSLRALIAASNELPTGQEELAALYDRFLLRCFVDYVAVERLTALMSSPTTARTNCPSIAITRDDFQMIEQTARSVTLPPMVQEAVKQIWQAHREAFKEDSRELLSDRRLMKCLHLLRVSALTNGREEVNLSDVLLLKDCLWSHPDNITKVRDLVISALRSHTSVVPVIAVSRPAIKNSIDTPATSIGEKDVVISGFFGRGTSEDPLLVQSAEDLMHMAHSEVGVQNYHFRQTSDIDCSRVKTWMPIDFKGCFDGGKFTIKGPNKNNISVFSKIFENSKVSNLNLESFSLAQEVSNSSINNCSSKLQLIVEVIDSNVYACHSKDSLCQKASNSHFKFCSSDSPLIAHAALGSKFYSCSGGDSFFGGLAHDCSIQDCSARLHSEKHNSFFSGEVRNCLTERCFVFGGNINTFNFGGHSAFARDIDEGFLRDSVVGIITTPRLHPRIVRRTNKTKLKNNYSIDKNNSSESNKDNEHGQSIPQAMFTQRFFENYVDWDFKNVWQWNQKRNQPELRHVGIDAKPAPQPTTEKAKTDDLLTLQINENIWL